MNTYMVTLELHTQQEGFAKLFDEARLHFLELMREAKLNEMHLASNQATAWLLMQAGSEAEIRDLLKTLPIYSHNSCNIQELMGE